ncbi:MAG: AraC family transcriptional regulator [Pseudomonadota bacterium]
MLAQYIREHPEKAIGYWARSLGLAASTISRAFRQAFGVSPAEYRATARTLQAYQRLVETETTLSDIATQLHFSDQAHFTRAIRALTGAPPNYWRKVKNLQDTKPRRA